MTRSELEDYRDWYVSLARRTGRMEPSFGDDRTRDAWRRDHRRWADAYQQRFGMSLEAVAMHAAGLGH